MSRVPEIAFPCPTCGNEAVAGLDGKGRCGHCQAEPTLKLDEKTKQEKVIESCPACGSRQLYVQRDFNQKVGLGVVIVCAAFAPFTFYSSLIVAALVDAGLYAVRPEITICYRCHAHFRGFARNPEHTAFDLHIAEQYDVKAPPQA